MNAVAVVSALLERQILEYGAEPDGAGAEFLDIRQPLLDPSKVSALKPEEIGVVERLTPGRYGGVIEPVYHEEVNPFIPPVDGRRKCLRRAIRGFSLAENGLKFGRKER